MKKIFFALLLATLSLPAQVLEWEPLFVTDTDSIAVYYNAAEGNGALEGMVPIYYHTGVITENSTSPTDWKYVTTEWGTTSNNPTLVYQGNDIWMFKIDNIRDYYGVPEGEAIEALAFVFRNADGSVVGRDTDGSDLFVPLSDGGLDIRITEPVESQVFADLYEYVQVTVEASDASVKIELYVNEELLAETEESKLTQAIRVTEYGVYLVEAVAYDNEITSVGEEFTIIVREETQTLPLPAEGLKPGPNYYAGDPMKATVVLWAPGKEYAYLLGDFNGWQPHPDYLMHKAPGDTLFWVDVEDLSPGTEYAYQYLIDGELKLADAFAHKILDPWNDEYINQNATRYPNLKEYPEDATGIVSVLQTSSGAYDWKVDDFQKPPASDLIIYEMLIRDFTDVSTFQSVIDTLSYLKSLGITALELMPVNEFEGNDSWGYNPSFYFAVDKYYGPAHKLRELVDACHELGIAVIIDMVLNHSYSQHPLVQMYWDGANNRPSADNPWYNVTSPNPVFSWGYDFNHDSPATQAFSYMVVDYWLSEFNVDGFRFDFTKGMTNTPGDGYPYDAARINILKRLADAVWATDSEAYVILEHFAEYREERELANYGMMLWGNFNHAYNQTTMGWDESSGFGSIHYSQRGFAEPHLVGYMESHDEERLMYKNLRYGNQSGDYSVKELPTALDRVKGAAAFFFTYPGPKMIWQFGELGYDYSINYDYQTQTNHEGARTKRKPVRWDYYEDVNRYKLYETFSALIELRNTYDVFKEGRYTSMTNSLLKTLHIEHDSGDVVIFGSFKVERDSLQPGFTATGTWYDFFSGDSIEVTDTEMMFHIEPGKFHIYSQQKFFTPKEGILTDIQEHGTSVPSGFELMQNYPNPFNPSTSIAFALPQRETVQLAVYNILGQQVSLLADGEYSAGVHEVHFNAEGLSSGIYLCRIQAGEYSSTIKLVVQK